jgi:AcrR family transcriptional regulator
MADHRMNGADRKQAIIEASRPLFAENGFNGTSVRAIAKAAGVSEALLYKYFPSKESLYKELLGYVVKLNAVLSPKLRSLEPGAESLVKYIYNTVRLILFEVPGFQEAQHWHERLLFRSLLGDTRYALAHFREIQNSIADRIPKCIEVAIKAGDMVAVTITPFNRFWFTHHLAMALNLCFLSDEPVFEYGGNKEELARQVVLFSLRGMGMTDEAIARCYRPEELEAFFHHLYG